MLRKYVGILWLLFVLSSNTIQKYHRMRVTYILKNFVKNLTSWWQNQSVSFELFIVITDQCYISEAILISVTIEQLWHAWWKFWPKYFFHFDSRSEKIFCYLIFCVYSIYVKRSISQTCLNQQILFTAWSPKNCWISLENVLKLKTH